MIKRETKDKKSSEWKDKKTPKNAELQGHRVPPEQKRIERKGGKQRRCGGGENTEGMLINKILFLDECRDAGLPLLRALSNLWDGSNKARLCGWEAREGEKIFWRSAPQWATTKQQAGYPAPPLHPHYLTPCLTTHWAATAASDDPFTDVRRQNGFQGPVGATGGPQQKVQVC